jgi:hypothetical protein
MFIPFQPPRSAYPQKDLTTPSHQQLTVSASETRTELSGNGKSVDEFLPSHTAYIVSSSPRIRSGSMILLAGLRTATIHSLQSSAAPGSAPPKSLAVGRPLRTGTNYHRHRDALDRIKGIAIQQRLIFEEWFAIRV